MSMPTEPSWKRPRSSGIRTPIVLGVLACVVALLIFLFGPSFWSREDAGTKVDQGTHDSMAAREGMLEPADTTPDRSQNDFDDAILPVPAPPFPPPQMIEDPRGFVAEWVERISLTAPTKWLSIDVPLERIVAATNAIAIGEDPVRHLTFLRPSGRFEPLVDDTGQLFLSPDMDARYTRVLKLLHSANTEVTTEAFRQAEPYLDHAYQKLGYPDGRFRPVLLEAIRVLRATPMPEQPIELIARPVSYKYADASLQGLDPAQRFLLRLSPAERLQIDRQLQAFEGSISQLPK